MKPIRLVALLVIAVAAVLWIGTVWLLGENLSPPAGERSAGVINPVAVGQLHQPPVAGMGSAGNALPIVLEASADALKVGPSSPQPRARELVLFPPLTIPPGGAVAIDVFAEGGPREVVVAPVTSTSQVLHTDDGEQDPSIDKSQ